MMQDSERHLMDSLGPKTPQGTCEQTASPGYLAKLHQALWRRAETSALCPHHALAFQSEEAASEPCTNPPQDRHLLGHQACPLRSSWQCLSAAFCEAVLDYQGCCTQGTVGKIFLRFICSRFGTLAEIR